MEYVMQTSLAAAPGRFAIVDSVLQAAPPGSQYRFASAAMPDLADGSGAKENI
jgi:hypothetical protein